MPRFYTEEQKEAHKVRCRNYYETHKEDLVLREKERRKLPICNERRRMNRKKNIKQAQAYSRARSRTLNGRYTDFKYRAKHRKLTLELTFKDFCYLVQFNCFYCQGPLPETGCAIDRLDSRLGYIYGNVAPCCGKCNFRKGQLEGLGFIYPRTVELIVELNTGGDLHGRRRG